MVDKYSYNFQYVIDEIPEIFLKSDQYYQPTFNEEYKNYLQYLNNLLIKSNEIHKNNQEIINEKTELVNVLVKSINEESVLHYIENLKINAIDTFETLKKQYIAQIREEIYNILKTITFDKIIKIDHENDEDCDSDDDDKVIDFITQKQFYKETYKFNNIDTYNNQINYSLFECSLVKDTYIKLKKQIIKEYLDTTNHYNNDLIVNNPEIKFYYLNVESADYEIEFNKNLVDYFTNIISKRVYKIFLEEELHDIFNLNGITSEKFLKIFLEDNKIKVNLNNVEHKFIVDSIIKNYIKDKYELFDL